MEDDDEIQSHPSRTPNGRITVTVASAPPPSNSLTLALPIQHHKPPVSASASGGGREDCWSEGATAVLIEAWGERYLQLSRGNLKQKHWQDVAAIVTSRDGYSKTPKTDIQCKNRIDTVKKKYKTEKAKTGSTSNWKFFHKLDELIGPNSTTGKSNSTATKKLIRKRPHVESDGESDNDTDNSVNSSDGLPPERVKGGDSMRELTRAIMKFGEAYEQAETAKLQQMVEMEKQRMKFAKDLELQRMQYFVKTQMEISEMKNRRIGKSGNHNHNHNHNGININNDATNNLGNNSDSSN